jgi:hypothetical protein
MICKSRLLKKCGYEGKNGSTMHNRRNSNLPEELERAHLKDAR